MAVVFLHVTPYFAKSARVFNDLFSQISFRVEIKLYSAKSLLLRVDGYIFLSPEEGR